MTHSNSIHLQYEQLASQARTLFFIFARSASASRRLHPPTQPELASAIETVWNTNRLQDLSDPDRTTILLKAHLASSTADLPKAPSKKLAQ
jgi:hypothetical protein